MVAQLVLMQPREAPRSLRRQRLLDELARLLQLGVTRFVVGLDCGSALFDLRLSPLAGLLDLLAHGGDLCIRLALQLPLPRLGLRSRRFQLLLHRIDFRLQLGLAFRTRLLQQRQGR
jgi:hypothetical protein